MPGVVREGKMSSEGIEKGNERKVKASEEGMERGNQRKGKVSEEGVGRKESLDKETEVMVDP